MIFSCFFNYVFAFSPNYAILLLRQLLFYYIIISCFREGTHIKINSPEYRVWKVRQNKKNLLRRTRTKAIMRARRTAQILSQEKKRIYEEPFRAPTIFSFIENPSGTIEFFENITSFLMKKENFGQVLLIDISQVQLLTIDALMYLLAVVNNLKQAYRSRYSFRGNFPHNPEIRKLVRNSGFYQFVHYQGTEPITRDTNTIQIVSGEKVSTSLAKKICDFVMEKGNVKKSAISFLYNMMIELMANVYAHAYNGMNDVLCSRWYCFVKYDMVNDTVNFSFIDTGAGIPSTVRRHGLEHLDLFNLIDDGPYVLSALRGELRSKTKEPYRGKGLPKIFSYCQSGKIKDMRIITNKCDVNILGEELYSQEIPFSLKGTLFYWQIILSNF